MSTSPTKPTPPQGPQPLPSNDGDVFPYAWYPASPSIPRFYYVNGIQTDAQTHADSALELSWIAERTVYGVYNRSAGDDTKGMLMDLVQCGGDWVASTSAQLAEWGNAAVDSAVNTARELSSRIFGKSSPQATPNAAIADEFRKTVPSQKRIAFIDRYLSITNAATGSLFRQLRDNIGTNQRIVAHSQGNLITCDALWAMVLVYGQDSLKNLQVYSLSSPAPAWPQGLTNRRKVYGHKDDFVTLLRPSNVLPGPERIGRSEGDWRQLNNLQVKGVTIPNIAPHDLMLNMYGTNFANRIRMDMNLPLLDGYGVPPNR